MNQQVLKPVLELGPTLAFFVIYLRIRDRSFEIWGDEYSGFIVATLIFVPILLVSMGLLYALTGKLSRMQIFTAFMVIFFGGLTAWFNDERLFKIKTTLVYAFFGSILAVGLLRKQSYMQYVMEDMVPISHIGWMMLTRRITGMFFALAIANEIVWRSFSTDTWVKVETFGFPIVLFLFLWVQMLAMQKHMIDPDNKPGS